jgi:hypothetical protein
MGVSDDTVVKGSGSLGLPVHEWNFQFSLLYLVRLDVPSLLRDGGYTVIRLLCPVPLGLKCCRRSCYHVHDCYHLKLLC